MLLGEVLNHLNNWFIAPEGIHTGKFAITGGSLELPFLQPGQYYRIVGSLFNDGLHRYPHKGLANEEFDGAIWALAIPAEVVAITIEIEEWQKKYGAAALGPYSSESFGGYSYTKATASNGQAITWQAAFRSRLNPWRKAKRSRL